MNREKGFTLIELLVVIAIIGILATVVLASLNSARDKAKDAKVKAQLQAMHPAAIMYYDNQNPNSYDGVCTADLANMVSSASATCEDTADKWAAVAPLATGGYWCVDSTGYTGNDADGSISTSNPACSAS